jgi:acylaminoacyl-peptidase
MTTWLLGHDAERVYRCGVSMRAVNDYLSFAGASDIPRFIEGELGTTLQQGERTLFERSPIRAAGAIAVPLLIMHSERDFRCPIDQGEQLFQHLRLLGVPAEFVRFTGDGHDLSRTGKPRNRVLRLRALTWWFERYLRDVATAARPGWVFAPLDHEAESLPDALPVG